MGSFSPTFAFFPFACVPGRRIITWGLTATFCMYAMGIFQSNNVQVSAGQGIALFALLVSLYWTSQVLVYISHVTTSGPSLRPSLPSPRPSLPSDQMPLSLTLTTTHTNAHKPAGRNSNSNTNAHIHTHTHAGAIASWWLVPPGLSTGSVTCGAFKRATTTSLGSICLGALLVGLLQALRAVANSGRRRGGNGRGGSFIACCLSCILACLERLLRYFNHYAFVRSSSSRAPFLCGSRRFFAASLYQFCRCYEPSTHSRAHIPMHSFYSHTHAPCTRIHTS